MDSFFREPLKDVGRQPQIDDVATTGDAETSSGIIDLILNNTNPERIKLAGEDYKKLAEMCDGSVQLLSKVAAEIMETLGGDKVEGILKTFIELQRDLARIGAAARSVGIPLAWYGRDVLPWFHDNIPRVGDDAFFDWMGDNVGETDTNAHALARHHLRQLNRFMGDVHTAMGTEHLEQHAVAPQGGGLTDPSLPAQTGLPTGLPGTGNPYAGAGLGSPYGTPNIPGMDGSRPRLDTPGLNPPGYQDPNLQNPGLQNPSPRDPSLQNPSLPNPNLPGQTPPDYKAPDFKTPEVPATPRTPTNLAELPQTTVPNPATPGNPGGPATQTPPGNPGGPGSSYGAGAATQLAGAGSVGGARGGMPGTGMGMVPPMMGGGQGGQERDRDRTRFPLLEDETFETDDMGGPSVIA